MSDRYADVLSLQELMYILDVVQKEKFKTLYSKCSLLATTVATNFPESTVYEVFNESKMHSTLHQLLTSIAIKNFIALSLFLLFIMAINYKNGYKDKYFFNKNFRVDSLYTLLLIGGVYGLIALPVITWLYLIIKQYVPWLFLDLLKNAPHYVHFILFIVVIDFCHYWKHRWMHSVRFLRPFHLIHHAAEELNFLTNYRIHLIEHIMDSLITLLPVIILGVPNEPYILVYFILIWYGSLLHSDLNLSFGWFDKILISPLSHSLHHSDSAQDNNANYGVFLSIWDILFKTARFGQSRPSRYGIKGLQVPQTFVSQFFFSFYLLLKPLKPRRAEHQK